MPAGFIDYRRPAREFSRDRATIAERARENQGMARKKAVSAAPAADPNVKPLAAALTPLELHAVAKAGGQAAKLRDRLSVGLAQHVDVTVRIHGALSVGEDQPGGTRDERAPADVVLGRLLPLLKPSARQSAIDSLVADFGLWLMGGELPKLSEQQDAIACDFWRYLSRQVHTSGRRGTVSGAIGCELIERGAAVERGRE